MSGKPKSGNRKQIVIALLCLAAVAVVLLGAWLTLAPKGTAGDKTVYVQVIHGDGSTRDFTLNTQHAYLGPALVEGGVVVDNQSAYGLYILTADGESANEDNQEWWQITQDGERVNTGADATPIADGDHFEVALTVGYDG